MRGCAWRERRKNNFGLGTAGAPLLRWLCQANETRLVLRLSFAHYLLGAATLYLIYPSTVVTVLAMTQLLERAISEAARLPDPEQDALASLLLEEISSEARWSAAFADSQSQLAQLAADALTEFHAGHTLPLDPERDLADH